MDTSEAYIKMCREAKEIQLFRYSFYNDGDIIYNNATNEAIPYCSCCNAGDGYIWLPRQDQLKEMVSIYDVPTLIFKLSNSYRNFKHNTWEQLLLSFVMSELYEKHWTRETWTAE
jgi:hypothetical protein